MAAWSGGIERNEMTAWSGGIDKNEMTAWSGCIDKNEMTAWSGGMVNEVTSGNPNKFGWSTGLKKTEKLKKDEYEQRRVLERVAQTHFVVGSRYDTDDLVSHGSEDMSHGRNKNSDARSHDRNLASVNRFSGLYLNRGALSVDTMDKDGRQTK